MTTPAAPPGSQTYHPHCEATVNIHLHLEMYASYVYQSMALYFERDDVSLRHLAQYFLKLSRDKKARAERLMELQSLRGACARFHEVQKPEQDCWQSGLKALEYALHLEKSVHQNLLDLHQLAAEMKDAHLRGFLECYFLGQQLETVKELGDRLSSLRKLRAAEDSMAEHLFNKLTLRDSAKKN